VLDLKYLKPIWKIIKNWLTDIKNNNLDNEDISNLLNWYNDYNIIYSYPEGVNKLSKKWDWIFDKINQNKWEEDLMWLVEIAIWRLLQAEFEKRWYDVRVRKTSNFDDITSWIDYVVEFNNKKWEIYEVVWVDFTISEKWADSLYKNVNKSSNPKDYKKYFEKKNGKKLWKISRIVMKLSRDLAYSFTNNFFITVLEEWHLLDNENIKENFKYALEDIKWINTWNTKFKISHVLEDTKSKTNKLLDKF
jgi:hypothetical protein